MSGADAAAAPGAVSHPPVHCHHFSAGRCGSCTLMGTPYRVQLQRKDAAVRELLAAQVPATAWEAPLASAPEGFRTKAKFVVGGSAATPTLGILDEAGRGVDLRDCGLHVPELAAVADRLARFVTRAALPPYDLARRRGELKHLVLTAAPSGDLMLRLVLRTEGPLPRIREHLPGLLADLPQLRVVSANLHPEHKATLSGEVEIALTEQTLLPLELPGVTLFAGPGAFVQTNTTVAAALYQQATAWLVDAGARRVADLYCGVGGFALHAAAAGTDAVGVEIAADAVRGARAGAASLAQGPGGGSARFVVADASDPAAVLAAAGTDRDAMVVNPPRRGLGPDLPAMLDARSPAADPTSALRTLVYSSCNPATLATDLAGLPHWQVRSARLFDMFPNTDHAEVVVLLEPRTGTLGG